MTIIDDYLEEQEKYTKLYGESTIVMMQVGHFFEAYAVDNDQEKNNSKNLYTLSDVMNIQLTRKNKKIIENSRKNPLMIGFNLWSVDKYIQILTDNHYTIIMIEQDRQGPNPERNVSNIISPGLNIKYCDKQDSNNLFSVYLEASESHKNYKENIHIGVSCIDVTTGHNSISESHSLSNDKNLSLDDLYRLIQIHNPKEIVFSTKNFKRSNDFLISYLNLSEIKVHFKDYTELNKSYFDLNYQEAFLLKIFNNNSMLSIIEYLDLEKYPFALISYIILLDFAYNHNENIINKINKPMICENGKYLILTNNTINQLNVINNSSVNSKYSSLYGVLNNNSTAIGRRLLRERLLNPIIDVKELKSRYNLIEYMRMNKNDITMYVKYEEWLNKIIDIERLHRKISLGLIQPADFCNLDCSYKNISLIIDQLKSDKNCFNSEIMPNEDIIEKFNLFIEEYTSIFDMDNIMKYHLDRIDNSFFVRGVCSEIDSLQHDITRAEGILNLIAKKLSEVIDPVSTSAVKVDSNEKYGYFLNTTEKRGKTLIKNLSKKSSIKIHYNNETIEMFTKDIKLKDITKSATKIHVDTFRDLSVKLSGYHQQMRVQCSNLFVKKVKEFDLKYNSVLKKIAGFVGIIDNIKCGAKTSILFNYVKPNIDVNADSSYLDVKGIRHPIIERINDRVNYVTNDLIIGKDINGMLLFGTNASGKSSLMKAIGLNIIMAQAGMYVAASEFKYHPYNYMFSRIHNNDNIFKGESSFAVEMSELRSILKRSNNKSIVLGDELCSGTESVSAQSIFASSVVKLSERKTNFIFATHLHELCNISQITDLSNVKMFHLKVIFDKEKDQLIYDRKLEEGSGPAIYGLEVCKAMDMDEDFLDLANNIRRQILNIDDKILNDKKSHFNSKIFVDNCNVCGDKADEVHHIKFQCSADPNNMIDHIEKNAKSNLVPLCKCCHDKVHNKDLLINGYIMTSDGIKLDFKYLSKEDYVLKKNNRKKYNEDEINIVISYKEYKLSKKTIKEMLIEKHNISISSTTINKIWNSNY
jgi:DNA mismatch repair protein MutS